MSNLVKTTRYMNDPVYIPIDREREKKLIMRLSKRLVDSNIIDTLEPLVFWCASYRMPVAYLGEKRYYGKRLFFIHENIYDLFSEDDINIYDDWINNSNFVNYNTTTLDENGNVFIPFEDYKNFEELAMNEARYISTKSGIKEDEIYEALFKRYEMEKFSKNIGRLIINAKTNYKELLMDHIKNIRGKNVLDVFFEIGNEISYVSENTPSFMAFIKAWSGLNRATMFFNEDLNFMESTIKTFNYPAQMLDHVLSNMQNNDWRWKVLSNTGFSKTFEDKETGLKVVVEAMNRSITFLMRDNNGELPHIYLDDINMMFDMDEDISE